MNFVPRSAADLTPLGSFPGWFSALLRARGVDTEEKARHFLSPSLSDFHDPFLLSGMEEAVRLIRDAIAAGDRIMIFGDYDADGVCATAILLETLTEEGAQVSFRLPSRHTDGYGLNERAVREIAEKARLLITVDCGISNRAEVALAKSLGMKVIVTDHHQLPETLPEADVILEPLLGNYPCPYLCGAGVALKLCQALQGLPGAEKRLDLAAVATVADVVPLLDENRALVREGIRRVESTSRPGLKALIASAGLSAPLRADDLAFRIAPRINAAGRLGNAAVGVQLLLTGRPETARNAACQLEEMNRRRQEEERAITAQAIRQAEALPDLDTARALVVAGDWNPGLIGLAAGRLCEKYYLPVVALGLQGETAVGSCRSIPGVNIFEMLQRCGDLLVRFGGHAQAAGLTVRTACIDAFRDRLSRFIRESCPESSFVREMAYDLEVPFGNWTPETLRLLDQLEPCGCGNPSPVFLLSGARMQTMRRVGRDGSHLQLTALTAENDPLRGIAFSMGAEADHPCGHADLLYRPIRNDYQGRVSVEAQVLALERNTGDISFI